MGWGLILLGVVIGASLALAWVGCGRHVVYKSPVSVVDHQSNANSVVDCICPYLID